MQLEHQRHIGDLIRRASAEGKDALRPVHELDHFMSVEVLHRQRDRGEAKGQLRPQQQDDHVVGKAGRGADARVEEAAVDQQGGPDDPQHPGKTARDNRQQLLGPVTDPQRVEHGDRGQQAHHVTSKDHQHAKVEQDRPDDQLLAAQELARSGAPRIGLAIITDHRPHREDGECDVGIDPEQQVVDEFSHERGSSQVPGQACGQPFPRLAGSRRCRVR